MIPLLAVIERPDMPRSLFDIPGANFYNLSMFFVLAGWFFQKKKEPASDLPKKLVLLVSFYLFLSLLAFARMFFDMDGIYALRDHLNIPYPTTSSVLIDYLLDPIKFLIPGFLIASISLSTQNARLMIYAIFGMGVILALEVIRVMQPGLIGVDDLSTRALRVIDRDVGYHRVATATILSMMASGLFGLFIVLNSRKEKCFALILFLICTLALALTGGRAGMLGWAAACVFLGIFRYKKVLIVAPFVFALLVPIIPGLQERIFEGFNEETHERSDLNVNLVDDEGRDLYAITSGRAAVWPLVINSISEAPWTGHGMNGMQREGISLTLYDVLGVAKHGFSHPHNMYLESLLNGGVLGTVFSLGLIGFIGISCFRVVYTRTTGVVGEVGVALLGMIIAFLVSGLGSGTLYPHLNSATLCCTIGLYISTRYRTPKKTQVPEKNVETAQFNSDELWLKKVRAS
ncbi:O-antigen ligase family protein [Pseudomonadales bacterium]|nr:O-antigen ligase family protein [Pseudomonadales bacterium]